MAAMLAGVMMLDFLGQPEAARSLEGAVVGVLAEARVLTPDLGGRSTTGDVTGEVISRLNG